MLMTDGEIKQAIESGSFVIKGFGESQLQPCSYDARAGREALVSGDHQLVNLPQVNSLGLDAGDFALIMTHESFTLPLDMAGHIGMKSSLARRGLVLLAGMHIDPGFDGHLRLGFYNSSGRKITIDHMDEICTIEFHRLSQPVKKGILPMPDLKEGRIPNTDKAFLRELETVSLSALSRDMRTLTRNMNTLTTITYKVILPLLVTIFGGVIISVIFN